MTALAKPEARPASFDDMRAFAEAAVKSRFYGFTNADQLLPLMIVAQSQGRAFTSVVEEYSVIQNKPALKAEAMLARFQKAGGHIEWKELSDTRCAAIFSHAQCSPVEVDWDMDRAKQAGLGGKDMWKKFPRNMLKARVISDGVRTAYPTCLGGVYTPEEISDFEPPAHEPQSPSVVRGQLAAPEKPGQAETSPEPSSSSTNEDGDEVDQTTQPEWPILEAEMDAHKTREALKAWWLSPAKKELKQRKPHLMRAFYRFAYTPRWEDIGETVWEDEPEAAG